MTWKTHQGLEQEKKGQKNQALDGHSIRLQHKDVTDLHACLIVCLCLILEKANDAVLRWRVEERASCKSPTLILLSAIGSKYFALSKSPSILIYHILPKRVIITSSGRVQNIGKDRS